MNKKSVTIILASIFVFSGCTGYQKMGSGFGYGGYNELKLSQDTYAVEYDSDSDTSHNTNLNYALRRAAEITKKNGCKYFVIKNSSDTSRTGAIITKHGGGAYVQPGIYMVIKMSKKKVADSFDANAILSNFKNKG